MGGTELSKPGDQVPPGTKDSGEDLCRKCAGSGKIEGVECPECLGTGKVTTQVAGA